MSAPVHPTVQEIADTYGVSRRLMFQAVAVRRYGCEELNQAAQLGVLALKHCETLAKAFSHDDQRKFLEMLPTMSNRERHDLLEVIKGELKRSQRGRGIA